MKTTVTWRDAIPADLPRILELWDEQEKRFASTQVRVDRPQLFWENPGNHEKVKNPDVETLHGNVSNTGSASEIRRTLDYPRALKTERTLDYPRALENRRAEGWRYKPPIMRLRVAEKNGQIVGFRYVEAVPEVCLVTGDEDVMKTLGRELTEECYLFKSLGFRSGWGLVPEKFAKALARFTRYSPVRLWKGLRLIGCDFSELGD